jgi:hypothetical protein
MRTLNVPASFLTLTLPFFANGAASNISRAPSLTSERDATVFLRDLKPAR